MKQLLTIMLIATLVTSGQAVLAFESKAPVSKDTANPLEELMKVAEGNYAAYGQFREYRYIVEDVDSVTRRDTSRYTIVYKQGKYAISMDSMEIVQDSMFKVTVKPYDSIIVVEKPTEAYRDLLQVDLFDTTLHVHYIENITAVDSANTRTVSFFFTNESPYISYKISFDTTSYVIQKINYRLKKEVVPVFTEGYTPTKYINVRIEYVSSTTLSDERRYYSDAYIIRRNGVIEPTAEYTHFQIIDATQQ